MNEFLTIKLSSNPTDSIPWLVWSHSLKEVIASGEISNQADLHELVSYAHQRTVIGLLPSSDVLISDIDIPAGASRQLNTMLPFLMEDELTQDIEQLHFTILRKKADTATVATLEKEKIKHWLAVFQQAGMELKKLLPDSLALPYQDDRISALQAQGQWLFRHGEFKGAAIDEAWLMLFLQSDWFERTPAPTQVEASDDPTDAPLDEDTTPTDSGEVHILSYSDFPDNLETLPYHWHLAPKEMMMVLLSQGAVTSKINLLSGEFKVQASWSKQLKVWNKVAISAVILLAVLLIQQMISSQKIEDQIQVYRQESERIFRSVFPDRNRIPTVSYLKRVMEDEEKALSVSGSDSTFVVDWLAQLPNAFSQVSQVTIQGVQFDAAKEELRIQAQSDDFLPFEQLRIELEKTFEVEQGQLSKNGDQVRGMYIIRSKA